MEIPALDFTGSVPKRKGSVQLANTYVPSERITGTHAQLLLKNGQMGIADFVRREPVWLVVDRNTQDVVAVLARQPDTVNDGNQRGWQDGEIFYSAGEFNLHPFKEIGIPANLGTHATGQSEVMMPEMVLNGNEVGPLSAPARPQSRTFPPNQPAGKAATQPSELTPSLFTMERPRFNESADGGHEPWGNLQAALIEATQWAVIHNTEEDYASLRQKPLFGDDYCKFTTPRLANLLAEVQSHRSPRIIQHALVLGVNDGQNLHALAEFPSSTDNVIEKITAVQKSKPKGDKVRQRVFEQLAREHGEPATEQEAIDLAFGKPDYVRLLKSNFDKVDYKAEAGDAPFGLVVFDLYEDTPAATRTLVERVAQACATTSVWIVNHWNMPSVRQAFEQLISEQSLGCIHWKLELPGYMDEKGYDADFFGNGVCIFYLNRSQPA